MTADEPLPGILAVIDGIVGREKAIQLAIKMGGEELRLPKLQISKDHDLVDALGLDSAELVWRKMAGDYIYIPHAYKEVIRYLLDQGSNRKTIRQITGLTARSVRYYIQQI